MHAVRVVVIRECVQLPRQVDRVPEEYVIEIFAADGAAARPEDSAVQ